MKKPKIIHRGRLLILKKYVRKQTGDPLLSKVGNPIMLATVLGTGYKLNLLETIDIFSTHLDEKQYVIFMILISANYDQSRFHSFY